MSLMFRCPSGSSQAKHVGFFAQVFQQKPYSGRASRVARSTSRKTQPRLQYDFFNCGICCCRMVRCIHAFLLSQLFDNALGNGDNGALQNTSVRRVPLACKAFSVWSRVSTNYAILHHRFRKLMEEVLQ